MTALTEESGSEVMAGRAQAQEWLDRLGLLAAGLAGADNLPDVVRLIVVQSLSGVNAQGATLAIVRGDELQVVEATGFPQAAVARFLRFPMDAELPLARAARSRQPVWISSGAERIKRFPLLKGVDSGISSTASLPLVVGDVLVGVLGVAFAEDRRLTIEVRRFLLAMADLAALAVRRLTPFPAIEERDEPPSPADLKRAAARLGLAALPQLGGQNADHSEAIQADAAGRLTEADQELLAVVADAYERLLVTNEQLRAALTTRAVIDQAKGMVMMALGCTADEAFQHLVKLSSTGNEKLRQVAEKIVADAIRKQR